MGAFNRTILSLLNYLCSFANEGHGEGLNLSPGDLIAVNIMSLIWRVAAQRSVTHG